MIALRAWSEEFERMFHTERDDTSYGHMKREYAPFVFDLGFSSYDSSKIKIMLGSNYFDEDGNMMYESDFVAIEYDGMEFIGEVKFTRGSFYVCFKSNDIPDCVLSTYDSEDYKIVGNRYVNPELIKELD